MEKIGSKFTVRIWFIFIPTIESRGRRLNQLKFSTKIALLWSCLMSKLPLIVIIAPRKSCRVMNAAARILTGTRKFDRGLSS